MQFYLYSHQDLVCENCANQHICADNFYLIKSEYELIKLYPINASGMLVINNQVITTKKHSQILFHEINNKVICEIKPFLSSDNISNYSIKDATLRLVRGVDESYVYFDNKYYGAISTNCQNIKFEQPNNDIGILYLDDVSKNIILFNKNNILYCGQYIDSELTTKSIKIYSQIPNIFNIGSLIDFNLQSGEITTKSVLNCGEERHQINKEFEIIYFLEGVKCGRFKYAYNKLSYELKNYINVDTLINYFPKFDKYYYLGDENAYVLLYNRKIVGIYHFGIKDNLINNIY